MPVQVSLFSTHKRLYKVHCFLGCGSYTRIPTFRRNLLPLSWGWNNKLSWGKTLSVVGNRAKSDQWELLVPVYQTTPRYVPKGSDVRSQHLQNHKCHTEMRSESLYCRQLLRGTLNWHRMIAYRSVSAFDPLYQSFIVHCQFSGVHLIYTARLRLVLPSS
jgi:hypothetical protein